MLVIGALQVFSVDRDFCAVPIEHYPPCCIHGLHQQFPIDLVQTLPVLVLTQLIGLETLRAGRQGCRRLSDLILADQAERRVLQQSLRIVQIFVSRQATADRLPQ